MGSLRENLGYQFHDKRLLQAALTHPSYGADHQAEDYQRLEFLGDAVLELAVSRSLYGALPEADEGHLTRLRSQLVREETLADMARGLQLGPALYLSAGEEKSGGRDKPSILSDAMEALIAAVYLDGGSKEAYALIKRLYGDRLRAPAAGAALDAKSRLQEILQRDNNSAPVYEEVSVEGPPHKPVFTWRVLIDGEAAGTGAGLSKRAAQQEAAREALRRINGKELD